MCISQPCHCHICPIYSQLLPHSMDEIYRDNWTKCMVRHSLCDYIRNGDFAFYSYEGYTVETSY